MIWNVLPHPKVRGFYFISESIFWRTQIKARVEEQIKDILGENEVRLGEIEREMLLEKLTNDIAEILDVYDPLTIDSFDNAVNSVVETNLAGCKNGRISKRIKK